MLPLVHDDLACIRMVPLLCALPLVHHTHWCLHHFLEIWFEPLHWLTRVNAGGFLLRCGLHWLVGIQSQHHEDPFDAPALPSSTELCVIFSSLLKFGCTAGADPDT